MIHVSVNFVAPSDLSGHASVARLRMATWIVENAGHLERRALAGKGEHIVVLVGAVDRLPPALLDQLAESCTVHLAPKPYEELCREYPRIVTLCGGPYRTFTFGFLRWLLIERLFAGEPCLCYDGDIVHNVPLRQLADAFAGITRTATSTAFAAISDRSWFAAWKDGLKRLEANTRGFLATHAASLPGGPGRFAASPEEYFAKCLIEAGELPHQEPPDDFPFWIVPQPHLLPRLYNFVRIPSLPTIPQPMRYRRAADGTDMINDKPLAFWHMQKPFMSQLSALLHFSEVDPGSDPARIYPFNFYGFVPTRRNVGRTDPYDHEDGFSVVPPEQQEIARSLIALQKEFHEAGLPHDRNPFHPEMLYRRFFVEHDFSLLFNNRRWPKPDRWNT